MCFLILKQQQITLNPQHTHLAAHLHLKFYLLTKDFFPWLASVVTTTEEIVLTPSKDCIAET